MYQGCYKAVMRGIHRIHVLATVCIGVACARDSRLQVVKGNGKELDDLRAFWQPLNDEKWPEFLLLKLLRGLVLSPENIESLALGTRVYR